MSERIEGSYDDALYKLTCTLLYWLCACSSSVTCDPEWSTTVLENTNSLYAQPVSQPLTESGCRDHCAYDLPGCVAVDVDHNESPYPACWVHLNIAYLDSVYQTNGVRQHRINRTSPLCLWSTTGKLAKR